MKEKKPIIIIPNIPQDDLESSIMGLVYNDPNFKMCKENFISIIIKYPYIRKIIDDYLDSINTVIIISMCGGNIMTANGPYYLIIRNIKLDKQRPLDGFGGCAFFMPICGKSSSRIVIESEVLKRLDNIML